MLYKQDIRKKKFLTDKEEFINLIRKFSPTNPEREKNFGNFGIAYNSPCKFKYLSISFYELPELYPQLIQFYVSLFFPIKEFIKKCRFIKVCLYNINYPIIYFEKYGAENLSSVDDFDINKISSSLIKYYCNYDIKIDGSYSILIASKKDKHQLCKMKFENNYSDYCNYLISLE